MAKPRTLSGAQATSTPRGSPLPEGQRRRTAVSRNVIALGLTSMITDISSEMVVAVLPLYLTVQVGLSTIGYGLFEGAYQLIGATFRLVGGAAADRSLDHKRVALFGYALSAATRIGLIASTAMTVPIVPFLLVERIGKGIRSAPRDALISLSTTPERLGAAFGVHRALDTTGAMLGPLLAFLLLWLSPGAYDSVFVVSLATGAVGVLIIATLVESRPVAVADRARSAIAPLWMAVQQVEVRRIGCVAVALSLFTVSDGFVYLALHRQSNLGVAYFPLLFAGTAIVYLVLAIPLGRLADRLGRRATFIGGHGALLVLYLVLAGRNLSTAGILTSVMMLGAFYAATDGVLSAAVSAASTEAHRTSAIAVVTVAQSLGRLGSAVLFGVVWHSWGLDRSLLAFGVALAAAMAAASVALRRHTYSTPGKESHST